MTVPAPECRLSFRQQFERAVVARSHVEYPLHKLTNKASQRQYRPATVCSLLKKNLSALWLSEVERLERYELLLWNKGDD